jgi:uncharacterized repeat protein (TIGR01451 family)
MVLQRIFDRISKVSADPHHRSSRRRAKRRRMLLERMEKRELLANDLGVITGVIFEDLNGDGVRQIATESTIAGIDVTLYRDSNGNGTFDNGVDTLAGTDTSLANGVYRFTDLDGPDADGGANPDGIGRYFVVQNAIPGRLPPAVIEVNLTDDSGVRTALIDDYSATAQTVIDLGTAGSSTDSIAATEAIGGFRDIQVTNNGTSGLVNVTINGVPGVNALTVGSNGNVTGTALIQYDGGGNGITLDPAGLETGGVGVSLGGGAPGDAVDPDAGFVVLTNGENPGDSLTITVYSNGNSTSATIPISDAAGFTETFVKFSDFAPNAGVDFNDIGAIETTFAVSGNNDVTVSIVETRTPNVETINVANVTPLSLGGTLFFDNSANGQNNGVRDGGEAAINGVTVELYKLANANDTVVPGTNVAVTSQQTSGTGDFRFDNLLPGFYAVVIPASQFTGTAVLAGYANSTGNDVTPNAAPDPDDNVNNDDNGIVFVSGDPLLNGAVYSQTITLESNTEPTNDGDQDANTNLTLDFGFFPQIDLAINKSVNTAASTIAPGGTAVFGFVVDNLGPRPATGVTVTDVFPAGLAPTGIQNGNGNYAISTNGNTVTVTIGNLPVNGQATFELTATIGANQLVDLTNPASVSGAEVDIVPANNNDTALLDLPSADLSIEKTDLQDPVNAGDQLTYQITVTNNGPDAAAGVVVTDSLPAGVTFVSGNVGGNAALVTVDGVTGDIIANVGALANQAQSVITIVVDVAPDAATPLLNDASVTSNPNTDPVPTNNTTREDTIVSRLVDVAIDKTVSGSVVAGEVATYTVMVTNNGPSQATGVTVVDTLNAALSLVPGSFNPGTTGVTLATTGQTQTFTVGVLDADETVSFSFDVRIGAGATGAIPNTVTVSSTENDSVPNNNTDTVNINVEQEVDLVLTKAVDLATAVPGQDQLVYTFTVAHDTDSPSNATGVVVTDTLPAGLSGVVIDAPGADQSNFANGQITVRYNSLPAGQTRTFTVTVDINADATGTITNPASVDANETERDVTNNDDTAVTTLDPDFDVVVTKTVNDNTPDPGQQITYTVNLSNEGPSRATGVILSDPIPAGLTFVSATLGAQTGTSNGTTVTFPAVNLNPNQSLTALLTFTVNASATGVIANTASVPNLSAAGENDVTNNSGSVNVTVNDRVDLAITKTVDKANAQVGSSLQYTVMVTNAGPSAAQAVVVTDTLPAGVTFVSGTGPNSEALSVNNGVVTVNVPTLASQGSFSFTINGTVNANAGATVINTSTVSTTTSEISLANNTANASTNVDPMTASIAGSVYIDLNNNGVRNTGENGIAGVLLTLTGNDSLGNAVNRTATTNANGDYLFASLAAGTYSVRETQPAGIFDGIDSLGIGAQATVGDDVFTQLGLGQGVAATQFNFGERVATDPFSKRRFLASSPR